MSTNTKYVSVAGAGAHDGTSEANAWTMAEATANVAADTTVWCKAGTYTANDTTSEVMDLDTGGTLLTLIHWRAYTTTTGDYALSDGQPVVLDANTNTLNYAVDATTVSTAFNTFEGFQFTGAALAGVHGGTTTDDLFFFGCKFDNNDTYGIQLDNIARFVACEFTANGTAAIDIDADLFMQGCVVHDENGTNIPVTATSSRPICINSLFYGNGNRANFTATGSSATVMFIGNSVDGNNQAASIGLDNAGATNVPLVITNNIFFDLNEGIGLSTRKEILQTGHNLFYSNNTDVDTIGLAGTDIAGSADPFVDSGSGDYTPASGGDALAAAIDAGSVEIV